LNFLSANSINWGRLFPQIVYYFYAYLSLLGKNQIQSKEKINFVVPTGNFGNILAAWYAKEMGLPIEKLICASNINKVLSDFFHSGVYDVNRPLVTTISPSMEYLFQ
jgi:threonine synthase